MNPKILLVIDNGKIVETVANGTVEIYVVNLNELDGPVRRAASEIPCAQFDLQLQHAYRGSLVPL